MKPFIGITCGFNLDTGGRYYVNEPYIRCIERAGGIPLLLPGLDNQEDIKRLMQEVDGILLPGGVDVAPVHFGEEPIEELGNVEPRWDRLELYVARLALAWDLPMLGICRGIQLLNVAAGGSLYQDIPSQLKGHIQHAQKAPRWYASHAISIEPGSMLEELLGREVRVNSFHHQAIKVLATGFSITAKSQDGIIEAMESQSHRFVCGVQWHPELMVDHYPGQVELFRELVKCAASLRAGRT
jgi:putative glutamine amidotransferase